MYRIYCVCLCPLDLSSCDSDRYRHMVAYAAVMFAIYPAGIPLFVLIMLARRRHTVYPRNNGRVLEVITAPDLKYCIILVGDTNAGIACSALQCTNRERMGQLSSHCVAAQSLHLLSLSPGAPG